jgi:hypothetical protein
MAAGAERFFFLLLFFFVVAGGGAAAGGCGPSPRVNSTEPISAPFPPAAGLPAAGLWVGVGATLPAGEIDGATQGLTFCAVAARLRQ